VDDSGFQQRIRREIEAREIARRILGVREGASRPELKRAWREACKKHHPDRNPEDGEADRKLAVINCAYRLLAFGEPCEMVLEEEASDAAAPEDEKYNLKSAWGYFLWWRDEYFG
jgi:hypothetical protein